MQKKKVFISSVQSEFSDERQLLYDYLHSDALLGKFFEPFIFERVPAIAATPASVFNSEVDQCDIYLGLFGQHYGFEDAEGISPTEREFDYATHLVKTRYIFLKKGTGERHPKETALIKKAENSLVRKTFETPEQLKTAVYITLIRYLEDNEYIRTTPFDATLNSEATLLDLDEEKVRFFAEVAHRKRAFPFDRDTDIRIVLTHLNLIKGDRLTNAALLLFAHQPQRFFITSEIKCAHFHGLTPSKPIPSYQVYKGDVFEMIAAAVDFVLSKINVSVGERIVSEVVDIDYEIPVQAVTEAIVNAVAHRDYTSNGSVQVMLFADRLEISNPGLLPHGLTIDQLYTIHSSMPANPLLAEPMYLRGTIERMGTGTEDLTNRCLEKGLKHPQFIQSGDFRVILYRPTTTEKTDRVPDRVPDKVPDRVPDRLTETQATIQIEMQKNRYVSMRELSELTGISKRKILDNIKKMKQLHIIERIGNNKSGYWNIITPITEDAHPYTNK